MKAFFIDSLMSGPKIASELYSNSPQNSHSFRVDLITAKVIEKNEKTKTYSFTKKYIDKHNTYFSEYVKINNMKLKSLTQK